MITSSIFREILGLTLIADNIRHLGDSFHALNPSSACSILRESRSYLERLFLQLFWTCEKRQRRGL